VVVVQNSTYFQNDNSVHKRKQAPNLSGTTGRGRKSKPCRGPMATCSSIPHLIVVFNYGDAMMPLDMLQTIGT